MKKIYLHTILLIIILISIFIWFGNQYETNKIYKSISSCEQSLNTFYNSDKKFDKNIEDLVLNNKQIDNIKNLGYTLKQICRSNNSIFVFFDFEDGFWKKINSINNVTSTTSENSAMILVMDSNFRYKDHFPVELVRYSLEGLAVSGCFIDRIVDAKILYVCDTGSEGTSYAEWYAYDIATHKNVVVKEYEGGSGVDNQVSKFKSEIFYPALFKLFTEPVRSFKGE